MAGHSKWANIKHKKARADSQKGKVFTKIARELVVAAREGGADPQVNHRLKLVMQKAREANMPNDNIMRAIQKGTGELEGVNYEEIFYEGYGAGGTAILLKVLTDNRNRTASEIRHLFSRHGGNLGEAGCVAWMFELKGYFEIKKEDAPLDEDELLIIALEAGIEDMKTGEEAFELICDPQDFEKVKEALADAGLSFLIAEVTMLPSNTIDLTDEKVADQVLRLVEVLEDHDDVQDVYANFDIPQEVMEKLG